LLAIERKRFKVEQWATVFRASICIGFRGGEPPYVRMVDVLKFSAHSVMHLKNCAVKLVVVCQISIVERCFL
jgi:hypothetical protein